MNQNLPITTDKCDLLTRLIKANRCFQRVGKGFCMTRDISTKISVMCGSAQISRVMSDGTSQCDT